MNVSYPEIKNNTIIPTRRVKYNGVLYAIVSIRIRIIPETYKNVANTFGIPDREVVCIGFNGKPTDADLTKEGITFGALTVDLLATKIPETTPASGPNSFVITDPMITTDKPVLRIIDPETPPKIEDLNGEEGREMLNELEQFIEHALAYNKYCIVPNTFCNMKIMPTMMCL